MHQAASIKFGRLIPESFKEFLVQARSFAFVSCEPTLIFHWGSASARHCRAKPSGTRLASFMTTGSRFDGKIIQLRSVSPQRAQNGYVLHNFMYRKGLPDWYVISCVSLLYNPRRIFVRIRRLQQDRPFSLFPTKFLVDVPTRGSFDWRKSRLTSVFPQYLLSLLAFLEFSSFPQ